MEYIGLARRQVWYGWVLGPLARDLRGYDTSSGIRLDPKSPGWRHFILAPKPDRRMGHVTAQFDSPYGLIESAWAYEKGGTWNWRVRVPPNTTATVEMPNGERREVAAGEHVFSLP